MSKDKNGNGIMRCPNCGASEIALNPASGKLKCAFCRSEFDSKSVNEFGGVHELSDKEVGEGAADIIPGEDVILTLKCGT